MTDARSNQCSQPPAQQQKRRTRVVVIGDCMYVLDENIVIPIRCGGSCSCLEDDIQKKGILIAKQKLNTFLKHVDVLHNCLINRPGVANQESAANSVTQFLKNCLPFLIRLETSARNSSNQNVPAHVSSKMLDFSQELSDKLEQLLLACASKNLISLDETQPESISPFCIGWYQLEQIKITSFRYCTLTPYLARNNSGLYKRMRWNVEMLKHEQEDFTGDAETIGEREHYFLCYEDKPNELTVTSQNSRPVDQSNFVRSWSIGIWVPAGPPKQDQISDWLLCETPKGKYRKIITLGAVEPPSSRATDSLQRLLLLRQYHHKNKPQQNE